MRNLINITFDGNDYIAKYKDYMSLYELKDYPHMWIIEDVQRPPAVRKTSFVEPPLGNPIDVTDILSSRSYEMREHKILLAAVCPATESAIQIARLENTINGLPFNRIIYSDEPDFYWTGRVHVKSTEQVGNILRVELSFIVDPYKRHIQTGVGIL